MAELSEEQREQLDGIVQEMISNNESEDDIQFVVDDFKNKYAGKTTPTDQDMSVDVTEVSEITESPSEDGSLELEETKYKTPLTRDEKISLQNNKFSKQMSKEDNFTKERLEELENKSEENVSVENIIGKTVDGEKDESIWEQSSRAFLEGLENIDLQIASSDLMKEFESDEGVSEESAKDLMVANENIKDNK